MLNFEKTLPSVRDLLDRLGKEGVEFTLVEPECSDCIADIRNPNKVYVFLECSIRPNGTFVWPDYDRHLFWFAETLSFRAGRKQTVLLSQIIMI